MNDTERLDTKHTTKRTPGFWKIETNLFDRIFLGVVVGIAAMLVWLRFVPPTIPLLIGNIAVLIFIAISIRWG